MIKKAIQNNKPVAVLISDIHFTVPTLHLASESLIAALELAKQLKIPLIICGDTLDGKAIMRGEVINELVAIFEEDRYGSVWVLVGNHDLINEKSKEHTLNFLPSAELTCVVGKKTIVNGMYLLPYYSDLEELKLELKTIPKGSTIICHQGVQTAYLGHYVQDKSSLSPETFDGYRVVSGHYHRKQDIKCGETGLFSYIGNPYTLSFAEANDGPKGFSILKEDGSLELIPLNLRKHVIVERTWENIYKPEPILNKEDILWVKIHGPVSELNTIDKARLGDLLIGHSNFKLDKIATDDQKIDIKSDTMTDANILDSLIDGMSEKDEYKLNLKTLWRELYETS